MSADHTGWLAQEIFDAKRAAKRSEATDFSCGPGLEPPELKPTPGYDYALPADGGRYRGKTPPQDRHGGSLVRRPH
jgi:hypothetical protein